MLIPFQAPLGVRCTAALPGSFSSSGFPEEHGAGEVRESPASVWWALGFRNGFRVGRFLCDSCQSRGSQRRDAKLKSIPSSNLGAKNPIDCSVPLEENEPLPLVLLANAAG